MPVEADLRPRGPYSLRLSGRLASDPTRVVRGNVYDATISVEDRLERVVATQRSDGSVAVRAESDAGVDHVRFVLGLDDDHSELLRRFAGDPLIGEATRRLRGLRPVRTATVAHALLRAVAGQLIQARRARQIEANVIRSTSRTHGGLHAAPVARELAGRSPAELTRLGLGGTTRDDARPAVPHARPGGAQAAADGCGREAARARARPRPVVGRGRLPAGARPLRAGPGSRSRARQARLAAARAAGRAGGDRRAAGALRGMGRPRERVPARFLPGGLHTLR